MSRNTQFPADPQLPRPDAYAGNPEGLLHALTQRLFVLFRFWIDSFNLLIRGYLFSVVSFATLPDANKINNGRMIAVITGEGAADALYVCRWNGAAYEWKQIY